MRQPRTQAAVDFKTSVSRLENSVSFYSKNRKIVRGVKDLFFGGLVSKLFADFENYVSDSISEQLGSVNTRSVPLRNLPMELRSLKILKSINHDHFRNYYAQQDESKFLENLDSQFTQAAFSWDGLRHYGLAVGEVVGKQGYPSEDNLVAIYKRFGIKNIFFELNKDLKKDSLATLRSINSVRCSFVHDSVDPLLSAQDFRKMIHDLTEITMSLDFILKSTVDRIK